MIKSLSIVLSIFLSAGSSHLLAADVALHGPTKIHFATPDEGVEAITKRDRFIKAQSRFDRQSRMKTDRDVSEMDLLEFVAKHVVAWEKDDVDKLTVVIESTRKKLDALRLPFPKTVLLVHTTGKEEGDAAYCRGNAIVLPRRVLLRTQDQLERLLLHELFHILSSHNPQLRKELYAILGFLPCTEIELPGTLKDRKITNPDAPTIDYYVEVSVNDKPLKAVPVLYASVDEYDAEKGESFFKHMLFRLMVIEKKSGRWQAVKKDGRAVVFDPKKVPDYFKKIGNNTKYIIHPDEILADNFVLLANKADPLPTPRIVEDMKKLLAK